MDEVLINLNKILSQNIHEATKNAKDDKCKLCRKIVSSFCNSHSLPQMILRNVSDYNKFNNSMHGLFPCFDNLTKFGVNNAGIFKSICNECDKKVFEDYEKKELIENVFKNKAFLSDKVIAEIMLKTALLEHYKKKWSMEFYKILNKKSFVKTLLTTDELDIKEYDYIIDQCNTIIKNGSGNNFDLIYYDVLNHQSEIASQAFITLQKIPTQETINDIFNLDSNYKIVNLLAVCYPWEGKTLLMLISFKEDQDRFKPFIDFFNSLDLTSKRKLFQCMLFSLSEEVYLSERLSNRIMKDDKMQEHKLEGLESAKAIKIQNNGLEFTSIPHTISLDNLRETKLYI